MLSQRYSRDALKTVLISREDWHPFPTADERDPWKNIVESVRRAHIARGEAALGFTWPPGPATLFLEYSRNGNRSNYQKQMRDTRRHTLRDLVIAECMEGKGRFVDDIVNGIWAICEETFWGIPACLNMQKAGPGLPDIEEPVVPLFVGETAGLLAWTLYLLGPQLDAVSPLIRSRLHLEMDRRVLTPCLERDDFGWMGFGGRGRRVNNWNPWINSNWLAAALLMEQDGERRLAAVAKILRSLDNFIDPYPKDGGCDEGPGYWGRAGASLFDCLETLYSVTGGAVDVYGDALIQNIGRFIYRVQIHGDYFVNFADASALINPSASIVFRFGKRIHDPHMMALGAWAAGHQEIAKKGLSDSIGRQLPALFDLSDLLDAEPAQPLVRDIWLPEIQVMTARDRSGSPDGLYVAAKGGHNAESHNHNDVGNFVVYIDGKPVLVDAGVEAYTRKTFGPNRYDIWTMQSAYHSLPTVNGVMQDPGKTFAAKDVAYKADDDAAELTLDIADAYPEAAGIVSWVRTVRLNRGKDVQVTDAYELKALTGDLYLSLLTPCEAALEAPGSIALKGASFGKGRISGAAHIHYDAETFSATTEAVAITDGQLGSVWGERLTRIILQAVAPDSTDCWTLRITA